MAIRVTDRGELIREYTRRETHRLQALVALEGYRQLIPEPPSALFVTSAVIETQGVLHPEDPGKAEIQQRITAKLRPETEAMLKRLDATGIPRVTYARSGGAYHQYAVKRVARWARDMYALINRTHLYWERPWWDDVGRKRLHSLLDVYLPKTLQNIESIEVNPELAIGDKEPDVGTGWKRPINTRRDLGQNIRALKTDIIHAITDYYAAYHEMVDVWPKHDAIHVLQTSLYRGIIRGKRSDPTVVNWPAHDEMNVTTTVREVGNTPDSPFHNLSLNPRSWREGLRRQLSTEYDRQPFDQATVLDLYTTPPATVTDPGEPGVFSIDFGYQEPTAQWKKVGGKWTIVNPKEQVKFGADNIVLAGLVTETSDRTWIMHLKSGEPFTELIYKIMAALGIAWEMKAAGIGGWYSEVGDDFHFVMTPEDIEILLGRLGPWMRTKGNQQVGKATANFIWGHELIWEDKENLIAFVVPRFIKTISSPALRKDLGYMGLNDRKEMDVSTQAQEQADTLWRLHPQMVFFQGTRDAYRQVLSAEFKETQKMLLDLGIADWRRDFLEDYNTLI